MSARVGGLVHLGKYDRQFGPAPAPSSVINAFPPKHEDKGKGSVVVFVYVVKLDTTKLLCITTY